MSKMLWQQMDISKNPWGELTPEESLLVSDVDVDSILNLLSREAAVIQFVGEKGRGKTTHLKALERHLPAAKFLYVPEIGRVNFPRSETVIIDEAQRFGWWNRRKLARHPGRLILGTHEDLSYLFKAQHRPLETVWVGRLLDSSRLRTILTKRLQCLSHRPSEFDIDEEFLQDLIRRNGGNIRNMLSELYSVFQKTERFSYVKVRYSH